MSRVSIVVRRRWAEATLQFWRETRRPAICSSCRDWNRVARANHRQLVILRHPSRSIPITGLGRFLALIEVCGAAERRQDRVEQLPSAATGEAICRAPGPCSWKRESAWISHCRPLRRRGCAVGRSEPGGPRCRAAAGPSALRDCGEERDPSARWCGAWRPSAFVPVPEVVVPVDAMAGRRRLTPAIWRQASREGPPRRRPPLIASAAR